MKRFLALGFALFSVIGCSGNDPFSVVQSDPNSFPPLEAPVPSNYAVQGYGTNGSDGFEWANFTALGSGQLAIGAPGAGLVTEVEAGTGAIFIRHSARLSTRLSGVPAAIVRTGDYVTTGAQIGTLVGNTFVSRLKLTVFVDGVAVCPLSYLSPTARANFQTAFGGAFPCIQ